MKADRASRSRDEHAGNESEGPRRAPDPEIEVTVGEAPLIPEGTYDAVGGNATVFRAFAKETLAVQFDVIVPDPVSDHGVVHVQLKRYYKVLPGPGGRLRAGAHSDYRREWILVAGRRPSRTDRLSVSVFKGVLVSVEVQTVKFDSRQHPLPELARYSKIARIVEAKTGGR